MERFGTPDAVFRAATQGLAEEDFSAVANCVDPFSLSAFRDELLQSERTLPIRDRLTSSASPAEAFANWLRWVSPRSKIAQAVQRGELPADLADQLCSPHPRMPEPMLVGVIEEDGQFAHILFRTPRTEPDPAVLDRFPEEERDARHALATYGSISFVQARRQLDGTWRLIAKRTFLSFDGFHAFGVTRKESKRADP
jgi:hypothetical protein